MAAWGSTSAQVDNADLFLEELSEDGRRVRHGDTWATCHEIVEQIPVKGEAVPVDLRVIRTPNGTVVARTNDEASSIFEPGCRGWRAPMRFRLLRRGSSAVRRARCSRFTRCKASSSSVRCARSRPAAATA